ncbi:MAG: hypothetical protein ABI765_04025, partial [Gemmatimonadota bacterium]
TLPILLILCVLAYRFVPPVDTGRALMQIDGHRALNDSATISIVTAALASVMLGMLGFYMVSSAVRRDLETRTGFVIAAMPVGNGEYLAGKFFGNAAYLGAVVLGYMVNVMGMHLLRGEAPLEPLVYLGTFTVMIGPTILVVSALALLFECVPLLAGRLGDILYLFVWIAMVSVASGARRIPSLDWHHVADVFGMAFMQLQVGGTGPHDSLSIGSTVFDADKSVWIFPGIEWGWRSIAPRAMTAALAVPLLLIAGLAFGRFDPAIVKSGATHARRSPLDVLNRALKPLARLVAPLPGLGHGTSRLIAAETALGLMLGPAGLLWLMAAAIASLVTPFPVMLHGVVPLIFLGLVAAIAEIPTRDGAVGMTPLLLTMPRMRERYLPIKLCAAASTVLLFLLVPLLRLLIVRPDLALSLVIGGSFVAAAAVSLGVLSGGPKAFAGTFLLFLYGVVRSGGEPAMDFAGFTGSATGTTRMGYALATAALLMVAMAVRRRREGPN